MAQREKAMALLQEEASLNEIVKLVGKDSLGLGEQMTLETAKMLREDFLQQNAFIDEDAYSSYDKQFRLLGLILRYDRLCREAMDKGADINALWAIPAREKIGRAKMALPADYEAEYQRIADEMQAQIDGVTAKGEEQ